MIMEVALPISFPTAAAAGAIFPNDIKLDEVVAENVLDQMRQKAWSIRKLAAFAELSNSYVSELLRPGDEHRQAPSMTLRTLEKLASALGASPRDLLLSR